MNEVEPELPDGDVVPHTISGIENMRRIIKAAIKRGELPEDTPADEVVEFTIKELLRANLIRPEATITYAEIERKRREGFGKPPAPPTD